MSDWQVLRIDIADNRQMRGFQAEIWIDPVRGVWCIGPPSADTSSSRLLMQVDPHRFFILERVEPAERRE